MDFVTLLWICPAIFTAVPMVARLLPFKLPQRAIPLLYFLVAMLCMVLPCRVDLALGAAGLISMIHLRFGESLANVEPPDMQAVANTLALGWDYIVMHLPLLPVKGQRIVMVDASEEDDKSEDEDAEDENTEYQEPPQPPPQPITQRIAHL